MSQRSLNMPRSPPTDTLLEEARLAAEVAFYMTPSCASKRPMPVLTIHSHRDRLHRFGLTPPRPRSRLASV